MAAITAQMVKELREKTGAGMMDCKKALSENDGDQEKAIDWLRQKGIMSAAKKSTRIATEGAVEGLTTNGDKVGVLVEVNSETDFTSRNDKFRALVEAIAKHVATEAPAVVRAEDGEGVALADQKFTGGDGTKTVQDAVNEAVAVIGENIQVRRFVRFESQDGFVDSYIHMGGKIGVLVEFAGEATDEAKALAHDVAMHVAAAAPQYTRREEVDASVLEREKDVLRGQLQEEGKPEAMWDKILVGKVNKFYKDICLLEQVYVKDPDGKKTVEKVIEETAKAQGKPLSLKRFARFVLGEGLEKKSEDFAAEVAKTAGL